MRFKDKVVIVTGGNSGIGKATAMAFRQEGAKVMVADLADEIEAELTSEIAFVKTNVAVFADVENMFAQTEQHFGRVDVLVNCAGILGPKIRTDAYPLDVFDKIMDVNVKGVWHGMRVALQRFVEQKSGTIVNIASIAGLLGMTGHIAYAASKHAVLGLTKTAAVEYAKYGIRVNAVCPGLTQTAMMKNAEAEEAYFDMMRQAIPMKRFGNPEEIVTAILYLASDDSSYITGNTIVLDGGLSTQ